MGRRGKRRKQLPDDLKEKGRYLKLKEEALYHALWRIRFRRSYGRVVKQTKNNFRKLPSAYQFTPREKDEYLGACA
jgi:hypothetical protein